MSELYWMITVTDRNAARTFLPMYRRHGVDVALCAVGTGTAVSETLDTLGLERTEKAVLGAVVTDTAWRQILRSLRRELQIDVPGTGVAFTVPLSSIGGKKALRFVTGRQEFAFEGESTLKETRYELLVVIANQGYSNQVMDAARAKGAGGGTVIHAKGTGMESAEQFFGVALASEKEMLFIVVRSEQKNDIMRVIMDKAGTGTRAGGIVFSLPVTAAAGMRLDAEETE